MSGLRVGIFGGSFNPVHMAHLIQADEARAILGLDHVLFAPARVPPHKDAAALLDGEERAALLGIALAGAPAFEVSRVDLDRPGPSYTVETIRLVRDSYPAGTEILFLMGADSLVEMAGWRSPEEILRLATVVVFPRPGTDLGAAPANLRRRAVLIDAPPIAISSEEIRARIRSGRPYRYLVPHGVWQRIEEKGHYRAGATPAR